MKYLIASLMLFSAAANAFQSHEMPSENYDYLHELTFQVAAKTRRPRLGTCWLSGTICLMPWKYNITKAACRAEGEGVFSWTPNGGECELLY